MTLLVDHGWIALGGALFACALAWWAYRRTTPALPPGRRWTLAALRALALALVFFLLAAPLLRRTSVEERPATVALLVDESRSIALNDSLAGGTLDSLLAAFRSALPPEARQVTVGFGAAPRRLAGGDTLRRDGDRTDIGRALVYPREMLREANVQAAVLVTDGRYTAGRNPVYVADDVRVPLFAAAVGDTAARRDVRISGLTAAPRLFAGAETAARVAVASDGVAAGTDLAVGLRLGERTVGRARVTLGPGGAAAVDLPFTPNAPGPQRLTATVERVGGEVTYRNNARGLAVEVVDDRRSVLLVAGAPEPDVAAVRAALESDAGLLVTARVQRAPGSFYQGPLPARLDTFDAVVLVGFPGEAASPGDAERIAEAAAGGVGLAAFVTARTDLSRLGALAGVLPVRPQSARAADAVEVLPAVTAAGRAHPILTLPDVPPLASLRLPPLRYPVARWQAQPGAAVLATTQERGVTLDAPLVAVRRAGASRAFALVGGGVWRWRTLPESLSEADALWPALVGNAVRWVSADDAQALDVRPAETTFGAGEPVVLTGTLYDESLQPVTGAQVTVDVATPQGETLPLTLQSLGAGRYRIDAGTLPQGAYRFRARAEREGAEIGTDAGTFAVGPVDAEFTDVGADLPLLQSAAVRTGGRAVPAAELPALAREVAPLLRPTLVPATVDDPLWDAWPLLVLLVLLLTAEWVLRKRAGLV